MSEVIIVSSLAKAVEYQNERMGLDHAFKTPPNDSQFVIFDSYLHDTLTPESRIRLRRRKGWMGNLVVVNNGYDDIALIEIKLSSLREPLDYLIKPTHFIEIKRDVIEMLVQTEGEK